MLMRLRSRLGFTPLLDVSLQIPGGVAPPGVTRSPAGVDGGKLEKEGYFPPLAFKEQAINS